MIPDLERLANDYKGSRSTLIAAVDCTTPAAQGLCSKHGVQGYPTIKVFKKGGNPRGEDYNGAREYNGLKRYVDANLKGPECSLEDKGGCNKDELKILEESEAMSVGDRRAKIKEIEEGLKGKKEQVKTLEKEIKEAGKTLELMKLGGEKPDKVEQLLGDAEFREQCEHRTCIIGFLPHILDGQAAERNRLLKIYQDVFKKTKADGHPVGFMWSQGGDQFDVEEKMSLQFGFPAVVAMHMKKERFGIHRGTFDKESLSSFIGSMMIGRVPTQPIPKGLKWSKADAWDGKDGKPPVEEEL
jgi:hypothetical protein